MAENTPITEMVPTEAPKKQKKRSPIVLIILLCLMILGFGGAAGLFWKEKTHVQQLTQANASILKQVDTLQKAIAAYKASLQAINVSNDSLKIVINQRIAQLDSLQDALAKEKSHGDAAQLASFKAKFSEAKVQNEDLLAKISKLEADKKALEDEKAKLNGDLSQEKTKSDDLTGKNNYLNGQVDLGKKLIAYQIYADPIIIKGGGKKEKITTKAKKAQKIRVSFKIGKNLIAKNEMKTCYVRIIAPAAQVLAQGIDASNQFTVNGESIVYSIKQDFSYENKEKDLTLYFAKQADLVPGKYKVEIYSDNVLIGEGSFSLE